MNEYTTADYLNQLEQDRQDLVDNLETQGISGLSGDETFTELVPEVLNISGGGDPSEYFNSAISTGTYAIPGWFNVIKKIPSLSASGSDMSYAFSDFPNNIDIPFVDVSNVTNYYYCFAGNQKNIVDLSHWNFTDKNAMMDFSSMFSSCSSEEINLSSLGNFSGMQQKNFREMFAYSSNLKKVNLSNFNVDNHEFRDNLITAYMFSGCSLLQEIDLSNFDFSKINNLSKTTMFNSVPTNCLIYVKNQTQVDWFTTNWPSLTNVQIKS